MLKRNYDVQNHNWKGSREALLESVLHARAMGDFDFLESACTDDVLIRLIGDVRYFPYCGDSRGAAESRSKLTQIYIDFIFEDMKIDNIVLDGDQACFRWSGVFRNRGTGASREFEGMTYVLFRGEKICEYVTALDVATLNDLKCAEE
ncbi:MAG: nuclear transport factor 2 family protein [Hyphomicrobiales bacterium]|nr:nuclear transport factor 2 family protein [Hyphomicrobiales bacterium]